MGNKISFLRLLLTFLKIGAFTFGGGYAILPIIQEEIVHRQKWVDTDDFMDILVITQSLPGPLALNCSLIIGQRLRGTTGGLVAALGIILPSFLIILLLAAFLLPLIRDSRLVQAIFYGLRPAVVALVVTAAWSLGQEFLKDRFALALFLVLVTGSLLFRLHPVLLLALGGLAGLLWSKKG
ncbi:MAG: chromate transporter [Firmicutes bacterium]|nr:chromate transporter [Bacillota bacterium]